MTVKIQSSKNAKLSKLKQIKVFLNKHFKNRNFIILNMDESRHLLIEGYNFSLSLPELINFKILKITLDKIFSNEPAENCEICGENSEKLDICNNCSFKMCPECDFKNFLCNSLIKKCPVCKVCVEIKSVKIRSRTLKDQDEAEAHFKAMMAQIENPLKMLDRENDKEEFNKAIEQIKINPQGVSGRQRHYIV
jgi:transcriptional regulator with PAS, ATPase and Fis domain